MRVTDFRIPKDIEEARKTLQELGEQGFLMAGGTSLVFRPGKNPRVAVDITRLGLKGIEETPQGFEVGALTSIAELQDHSANGWVLNQVARKFSTQQVRNVSTLGGNLARIFSWSDFPVALLVLECSMTIQGESERSIDGVEFLASQPGKRFDPGDILTKVKVERLSAGTGFGYHKEVRTAADFSMATAAAYIKLEGKRIKHARIALGGSIPFPMRLNKVEDAITGKAVARGGLGENAFLKLVTEALSGVSFKGKHGISDEYAARLSAVAVRDAIADAMTWVLGRGEDLDV